MQQHAEDEAPDASRCFVLTCVGEPDCRKQLLASSAAQNDLPLSDREPRDFHGPALGTRHERSAWASGCGHGKSCFAYTFAALMRAFSQLQHVILMAPPWLGSTPAGMLHATQVKHEMLLCSTFSAACQQLSRSATMSHQYWQTITKTTFCRLADMMCESSAFAVGWW